MARQAGILMPELVSTPGNMFVQKPTKPNTSGNFNAGALVTLTAGDLVLVATDGVLVYGQTPDAQHAATDIPPTAFFGQNHYCFDLAGGVLAINVGELSGSAIVTGATAATITDVTLGAEYAIATPTTGDYAGYQFLDPSDTSGTLFVVVGFIDGVLDDDYNGRVLVKIVPATIQP